MDFYIARPGLILMGSKQVVGRFQYSWYFRDLTQLLSGSLGKQQKTIEKQCRRKSPVNQIFKRQPQQRTLCIFKSLEKVWHKYCTSYLSLSQEFAFIREQQKILCHPIYHLSPSVPRNISLFSLHFKIH